MKVLWTAPEPAEDRAPTRRRILARGSESTALGNNRMATNTIIVDVPMVVTAASTRPEPVAAPEPTNEPGWLSRPRPPTSPTEAEIDIEVTTFTRREAHRTRRMEIIETDELRLDRLTVKIPLSSCAPSIDAARPASKLSFLQGVVMGVTLATAVATSVAAALTMLV